MLYHETLNKFLEDSQLDYSILGVGTDGHIASLFPEAATIATSNSDNLIIEVKDSYNVKVKKRMTLSFDVISRARSIAVLMMGVGKVTLMDTVAEYLRLEELCDLPLARLNISISMDRLAV